MAYCRRPFLFPPSGARTPSPNEAPADKKRGQQRRKRARLADRRGGGKCQKLERANFEVRGGASHAVELEEQLVGHAGKLWKCDAVRAQERRARKIGAKVGKEECLTEVDGEEIAIAAVVPEIL